MNTSEVPTHLAEGDMLGSCAVNTSSITLQDATRKNPVTGIPSVKATPNPSANYFTINMEGTGSEKIMLRITDILGRSIEQKDNIQINSSLKIGNTYLPGVYIVEVIQGTNRKQIKLIKTRN